MDALQWSDFDSDIDFDNSHLHLLINKTWTPRQLLRLSTLEEINDYVDLRDLNVRRDSDYLRDQLQFFLSELDQLPGPTCDFQTTEQLHTAGHFDNTRTGPVNSRLPEEDQEIQYFKLFLFYCTWLWWNYCMDIFIFYGVYIGPNVFLTFIGVSVY